MKIFTNNSVYVQISDINYLVNELRIILPPSVSQTVFGTNDGLMIIDKSNEEEFVKFTDEEAIKFFRDDNIILDYDEVKDLEEHEVNDLIDNLTLDAINIYTDSIPLLFTNIEDEEEREEMIKKTNSTSLALDKIEHRQRSLYAYINFLKGKSKMKLPEELFEEPKKKSLSSKILQLLKGKKNNSNKKQS